MLRRLRLPLVCLVLAITPSFAYQRSRSSSHSRSRHSSSSSESSTAGHVRSHTRKDGTLVKAYERSTPGTKEPKSPSSEGTSTSAITLSRDSRGRIKRSEATKVEFERETGYPSRQTRLRRRPHQAAGVRRRR
jgi:hypothetical protein